eukprot:gene4695-5142_t
MYIIGDETGLIKVISKRQQAFTFGEQDRAQGVISLCSSPLGQSAVAALRIDGSVEHWALTFDEDNRSPVLQLAQSSSQVVKQPLTLMTLSTASQNVVGVGKEGHVVVQRLSGADHSEIVAEASLSGSISAAALEVDKLLVGGRENDAQLLDLSTQQLLWKAKNVPNDKLNLRVPIWITSLDVLEEQRFLTATAYKQARHYDRRASDRPVHSFAIDTPYALTCIKAAEDNQSFYVADGAGNLYQHDLRVNGHRLHTFKGCTGSIRSLSLDQESHTLACVGLDRHLRVFNTNTAKPVARVYLKNRLNTLLCMDDCDLEGNKEVPGDDDEQGDEDEDDEEEDDAEEEDVLSDFVDSDDEEEEEEPVKRRRY